MKIDPVLDEPTITRKDEGVVAWNFDGRIALDFGLLCGDASDDNEGQDDMIAAGVLAARVMGHPMQVGHRISPQRARRLAAELIALANLIDPGGKQ